MTRRYRHHACPERVRARLLTSTPTQVSCSFAELGRLSQMSYIESPVYPRIRESIHIYIYIYIYTPELNVCWAQMCQRPVLSMHSSAALSLSLSLSLSPPSLSLSLSLSPRLCVSLTRAKKYEHKTFFCTCFPLRPCPISLSLPLSLSLSLSRSLFFANLCRAPWKPHT